MGFNGLGPPPTLAVVQVSPCPGVTTAGLVSSSLQLSLAIGLAKPGPPMCPHPSPASACLHSPSWPSQGCVWPCFPSPGLTLIPTHGLMSWPGLGLVRFQHRCLMPWGGGCLVQCPSSEQGQLWQVSQDHIQTRFEYLLVWRLHNRFGQLFQCLKTLTVKQFFLSFQWNFGVLVCTNCLLLCQWAPVRSIWLGLF